MFKSCLEFRTALAEFARRGAASVNGSLRSIGGRHLEGLRALQAHDLNALSC